jgi:hypothetical protein
MDEWLCWWFCAQVSHSVTDFLKAGLVPRSIVIDFDGPIVGDTPLMVDEIPAAPLPKLSCRIGDIGGVPRAASPPPGDREWGAPFAVWDMPAAIIACMNPGKFSMSDHSARGIAATVQSVPTKQCGDECAGPSDVCHLARDERDRDDEDDDEGKEEEEGEEEEEGRGGGAGRSEEGSGNEGGGLC